MNKTILQSRIYSSGLKILCLFLVTLSTYTFAQEGHPLTGTWSGNRESGEGSVRLLLIMNLQADQNIEGVLIENGSRIPLDITLNPDDWSVIINAQGATRSGDAVNYRAEGVIENLGTVSQRVIRGTWNDGNSDGQFSVSLN